MVDGLRHRPCTKANNKDCPAFGMYFKGHLVVFDCKVQGELVKINAKDKGTTYEFPIQPLFFFCLLLTVLAAIGARLRTAITCLSPTSTQIAPNIFQHARPGNNRPRWPSPFLAIHPYPFPDFNFDNSRY
jgi:hypothetical protein